MAQNLYVEWEYASQGVYPRKASGPTLTDMFDWQTQFQDAAAVVDLFDAAADSCLHERWRDKSVVRLPAHGKLLATGDLHDNPMHLEKILRLAALQKSTDHHVIFHEMIHGENLINGMDFSHRMLIRLAELKTRFPDQVHPLLANHELSQMMNAGVSKGAGDSVKLYNDAIDWVFGDDSERVISAQNRFLRAWPIGLITASGIMCAHSLPGKAVWPTFDRTILERDLVDSDYESRVGSVYQLLWGRRHSQEQLDEMANVFGVKAFCLGHEHAESGYKQITRNAMVLNSDHERAAVLPLDLAEEPKVSDWAWSIIPLGSIPLE